MLSGLYGILLGRQTVCIISHRVQHVEAAQTLVARIYVAGYIAQRMTHVQTGTRRIREHVQHVELTATAVIIHLIYFLLAPVFLQAGFYFLRIVEHYISSL